MDTQSASQSSIIPGTIAPKPQPSTFIKFVRIFLLILMIIGIGLLCTTNLWVPKLVSGILGTALPAQSSHLVMASTTSTEAIATTTAALVGSWQSTDDPNDIISFYKSGRWKEQYSGDPTSFAGTWTVLPNLNGEPIQDNYQGLYLKETNANGSIGNQYYEVFDITPKYLDLVYLPRGNSLNYSKISNGGSS